MSHSSRIYLWFRRTFRLAITLTFFVCVFVILLRSFTISRVVSDSMSPTIQTDDILVYENLTSHIGFRRCDIVGFWSYPGQTQRQPNSLMAKRIVGLPHETIEVTPANLILVNGHPIKNCPTVLPQGNYAYTITAAANQFVVLGDNRPESLDSHHFGPISRDRIAFKALFLIQTHPLRIILLGPPQQLYAVLLLSFCGLVIIGLIIYYLR